jgi:hypothetical protein
MPSNETFQLTCDFIGHDMCLLKVGRPVVFDGGAALFTRIFFICSCVKKVLAIKPNILARL